MTHPVLQGMLMMGCKSQQKVLLAFHTYLELCEVKVLWDVEYEFHENLDLIYLRAKSKKNAENEDIYIPISVSTNVTPTWIEDVQKNLMEKHSVQSFILVIKERDSSSVYYRISPGLVPPLSPETAKKKKAEEEKKSYMERELKKRRNELYTEAKKMAELEKAKKKETMQCDNSASDNKDCNIDKDSEVERTKEIERKENERERSCSPFIEIIDDQDDVIEL